MHPLPTHIACACMGPVYGEPLCPCEMSRRGLPSSPEHIKANQGATKQMCEFFGAGGEFHRPKKEGTEP